MQVLKCYNNSVRIFVAVSIIILSFSLSLLYFSLVALHLHFRVATIFVCKYLQIVATFVVFLNE